MDFKSELSEALAIWSETPGLAGVAVIAEISKLVDAGKPIPLEMVKLAVVEKNAEIIPILDELWFKNPVEWESLYGDIGPPAESTLIRRYSATQGTIRHSATRILGRIGTEASIPILDGAMDKADTELRVLLQQARQAVTARIK